MEAVEFSKKRKMAVKCKKKLHLNSRTCTRSCSRWARFKPTTRQIPLDRSRLRKWICRADISSSKFSNRRSLSIRSSAMWTPQIHSIVVTCPQPNSPLPTTPSHKNSPTLPPPSTNNHPPIPSSIPHKTRVGFSKWAALIRKGGGEKVISLIKDRWDECVFLVRR